ncbi:MAG: TPM domain-containing protein [Bacteroidia bacterium]
MKFPSENKWLFLLLLFPCLLTAKDLPEKTKRLVNDYADVLTEQQEAELERYLVAYNDSTTTQIAIVIERSLDDEALEDYTQRLAESWGIGQQGNDNGVLIYVAKDDRKMRIEVGYGLEPVIPDILAGRIMDNYMQPQFRKDNYYQGLWDASTVLMKLASQEFTAADVKGGGKKESPPILIIVLPFIIILIIFLVGILSWRSKVKGLMHSRSLGFWAAAALLSTMASKRGRNSTGWGSFHSGGGSFGGGRGGGGFGGFGGGSFGGGGASGSW